MDPGIPQNALVQVSYTLGRLVLWFRLQHLSLTQDTEHSEDTSGSQQLQTPLIVGGTVFLIGVHHSDVKGAGLTCGQELVLRGRRGRGG